MVRLQPGASGPGTRAWRAGSATHQDLFLVRGGRSSDRKGKERTKRKPGACHEANPYACAVQCESRMIGGKLTGETRTNPENLSGSGIEGGSSRAVAKGDFIVVPEGVPHGFSSI